MTMFHFLHKKDGFPANETVPKEAAPEIPVSYTHLTLPTTPYV